VQVVQEGPGHDIASGMKPQARFILADDWRESAQGHV